VNSSNNTEDFKGTLIRNPSSDEIIHTERVYVSEVNRCERFRGMVSKTIRDITVNSNIEERKTESENRLEHDGANPRDLVIECDTESEETHCAKDKSQNDRDETELGSVISG